MRKTALLILAAIAVTGYAHAGDRQNSMFQCVDKETLTVESECVTKNIESNVDFHHAQKRVFNQSVAHSGNAMATIRFYPERHLIEVVAHKDALEKAALLAKRN